MKIEIHARDLLCVMKSITTVRNEPERITRWANIVNEEIENI